MSEGTVGAPGRQCCGRPIEGQNAEHDSSRMGQTRLMSAYLVVNATITDKALLDAYVKAAGPTGAGHNITPLVMTNEATVLEGEAGERVVLLQFPSREEAMAWYNSEAYQAVIGMRHNSTKGFAVLVDGLG